MKKNSYNPAITSMKRWMAYAGRILNTMCRTGSGGRVVKRARDSADGESGYCLRRRIGPFADFCWLCWPGLARCLRRRKCLLHRLPRANGGGRCAAANFGAGVVAPLMAPMGRCHELRNAGKCWRWKTSSSTTVLLTDDVASAPKDQASKRRGVAGMVFAV